MVIFRYTKNKLWINTLKRKFIRCKTMKMYWNSRQASSSYPGLLIFGYLEENNEIVLVFRRLISKNEYVALGTRLVLCLLNVGLIFCAGKYFSLLATNWSWKMRNILQLSPAHYFLCCYVCLTLKTSISSH